MESTVAHLPVSHRAWAWIEKNKKPALLGTIAVLVVGLAIWFVTLQKQEKVLKASHALSDAEMNQAGFGAAAQESAQPYLKVAAEYPNAPAAARALLLAGGTLFQQGKYAEAEAQFQKFLREHRDSPLLGQGLLGVAASLEAQGKAEPALTAYKDLVARHPNDSVILQAKFAMGRLYAAQGKPELARDQYEQVERDSRFSSLGSEAGMRIEELMEKYPNLRPAPTPSPAPPLAVPQISSNTLPPALLTNLATTNTPATPPRK